MSEALNANILMDLDPIHLLALLFGTANLKGFLDEDSLKELRKTSKELKALVDNVAPMKRAVVPAGLLGKLLTKCPTLAGSMTDLNILEDSTGATIDALRRSYPTQLKRLRISHLSDKGARGGGDLRPAQWEAIVPKLTSLNDLYLKISPQFGFNILTPFGPHTWRNLTTLTLSSPVTIAPRAFRAAGESMPAVQTLVIRDIHFSGSTPVFTNNIFPKLEQLTIVPYPFKIRAASPYGLSVPAWPHLRSLTLERAERTIAPDLCKARWLKTLTSLKLDIPNWNMVSDVVAALGGGHLEIFVLKGGALPGSTFTGAYLPKLHTLHIHELSYQRRMHDMAYQYPRTLQDVCAAYLPSLVNLSITGQGAETDLQVAPIPPPPFPKLRQIRLDTQLVCDFIDSALRNHALMAFPSIEDCELKVHPQILNSLLEPLIIVNGQEAPLWPKMRRLRIGEVGLGTMTVLAENSKHFPMLETLIIQFKDWGHTDREFDDYACTCAAAGSWPCLKSLSVQILNNTGHIQVLQIWPKNERPSVRDSFY